MISLSFFFLARNLNRLIQNFIEKKNREYLFIIQKIVYPPRSKDNNLDKNNNIILITRGVKFDKL